MKSVSIPIENYNIDVSSPEQRWRNNVNDNLRGLKNKPRNAQSIPNFNVKLQKIDVNQSQVLLTDDNGFFATSFVQFFETIPNPQDQYSNSAIREIKMKVGVNAYAPDTGGYSPVVGISDFTIDFYVSFVLLNATNGNILTSFTDGAFVNNRMLTIPFTVTVPSSNPLQLTIEAPKSFRLSDTITNRTFFEGSPIFTTDPTKITQNQYENLTNQDNFMCGFVGFNQTQYNALSTQNQDQFNDLFNLGIGGVQQLFGVGVDFSLSYFGIGASYQPTS
jgi:hypothetical protein